MTGSRKFVFVHPNLSKNVPSQFSLWFITWYLEGKKVVSPYDASPYCLFPGCIVTWVWSLAKGQYMVEWLPWVQALCTDLYLFLCFLFLQYFNFFSSFSWICRCVWTLISACRNWGTCMTMPSAANYQPWAPLPQTCFQIYGTKRKATNSENTNNGQVKNNCTSWHRHSGVQFHRAAKQEKCAYQILSLSIIQTVVQITNILCGTWVAASCRIVSHLVASCRIEHGQ